MTYESCKPVGLNTYERWYFQQHFGTNLKRLFKFRKAISKEQSEGFYRGSTTGSRRAFLTKGGEYHAIWLTRKKVDAYINEVINKNKEYEKN